MKNYQELSIWQKAIDLVKDIYILAKQFPNEEKFGLISQMTRVAVSIPANIAEGSSRNSDRDYARFIQIALGSAFEVQTYLIIAKKLKLASGEGIQAIANIMEEEIKMLHKFLKNYQGIANS